MLNPKSKAVDLDVRSYFAAMALLQEFADIEECDPKRLARLAVETADALILELNKQEEKA